VFKNFALYKNLSIKKCKIKILENIRMVSEILNINMAGSLWKLKIIKYDMQITGIIELFLIFLIKEIRKFHRKLCLWILEELKFSIGTFGNA
jgi:hypothetical protein